MLHNARSINDLRVPPADGLEGVGWKLPWSVFDSDQRPMASMLCLDRRVRLMSKSSITINTIKTDGTPRRLTAGSVTP
jgi:hypothetical protein